MSAPAGVRAFPLKPGSKVPAVSGWPTAATTDPDTVAALDPSAVGLAMGESAHGRLIALDVDTVDGHGADGYAALAALEAAYGPLPVTWCQETPSGGCHLIFRLPEGAGVFGNGNALPDGIDVRGEGGFIKLYELERAGLDAPAEAPGWLLHEIARRPEPAARPTPTPSPVTAGQPDPLTEHARRFDWAAELAAAGWQEDRTVGDDTHYVRPGKDRRDGTSATLHRSSGVLVIWSTAVDPALLNAGVRTADGSGVSLNPFAWYAATKHGGDRSAAARTLNGLYGDPHRPIRWEQYIGAADARVGTPEAPEAAEVVGPTVPADGSLNMPAELWATHPVLDHVRRAALSRCASPDAVLGAVLARYATTVPPWIGGDVGLGPFSLNTLVGLVGPPGSGKSSSMRTAADLLPDTTTPGVRWLAGAGSGEGISHLYLSADPDNKGEMIQTRHSALLTVDEAEQLMKAGGRSEATLWPVIRTAWDGGPLVRSLKEQTVGVRSGSYRLAAIVCFQQSFVHQMAADRGGDGTPQRFVLFSATDPSLTGDEYPWPGPLDVETWMPPKYSDRTYSLIVEYPAWVRAEARDRRLARARGDERVEELQAHSEMNRLRIAALLALADGRAAVNDDDMRVAGAVTDTSRQVFRWCEALHLKAEAARREASNRYRAETAVHEATATDDARLMKWARRLAAVVDELGGETSWSAAQRKLSSAQRNRAEEIVAMAVDLGLVIVTDTGNGQGTQLTLGPEYRPPR